MRSSSVGEGRALCKGRSQRPRAARSADARPPRAPGKQPEAAAASGRELPSTCATCRAGRPLRGRRGAGLPTPGAQSGGGRGTRSPPSLRVCGARRNAGAPHHRAAGPGCRMQSQGRGPGGVGQAVREAWGLSGQEEDRDPRDVCEAPGPHTGGGWRRSPAGRGVVPGEEGFLDTWHPDRARLRSGRRDCHPPAAAPDPAATLARPCLAASCPETQTSDRERSTATGEPCGRGADNEARAPPPSAAPFGQSAPTPAGQSAPAAGLFKKRRTGAAPLSAGWIPPRM